MEESKQQEDSRSKIGYWLKWLKAAKKAQKSHEEDASSAWAEYEWADVGEENSKRGYPIYKTSVDKLESALFAKCPEPRSKRKFGIQDEMALTMALINDRLASHLIEDGDCFEAWCAARSDFVHAAKASVQVIYSTDTEDYRVPLQVSGEGKEAIYYEEKVEEPYDGEVLEENGKYFYNGKRAKEGTKRIKLAPCLFDEILHTPEAKSNAEVREKAYKFCLSEEEAEKLFNADKSKTLPYKVAKDYKESSSDSGAETGSPGKVLEGWEIYCSNSKKVYWVCEDHTTDFLLVENDNLQLRKFFPSTPFIFQNKRRKNLYPTPAWVYLAPTARQLTNLYGRIFDLIEGIQRKALVYGASEELIDALNSPGLTYVTAGKMLDILEKGGLQNLIQFVPVQELVASLTETIQLEEHFKNNFSEFFHLPEILRGQSDPNQSATQSEILQDEAHDTFRTSKELVVKLARDSVELMLDLAYRVYSDQEIQDIIGYKYLPKGTPAMPPSEEEPEGVPARLGHYERFPEALNRLRNDNQRLISIDFETDSSSFRDDKRELEKAQVIGKTAIDSLNMIGGLEPQFVPIGLDMTLAVLESMGGSSKTEDMLRKAVADLEKIRSKPTPPPPDTEMMKLEVKKQEVEIKALTAQGDLQLEKRKLEQEDMKTQLLALKTQGEMEIAKFESQFNAALEKALVQLEEQRVEIEKYKAEVMAQETLLEEIRLRQEADAMLIAQATESALASEPSTPVMAEAPKIELPSPQPMNLHVNVTMPKGGKKISKMIRPDGTETIIETDEQEAE